MCPKTNDKVTIVEKGHAYMLLMVQKSGDHHLGCKKNCKSWDILHLRKLQQIPGTYPRPSTTCLWRTSLHIFHICIFGYLGSVPGVCWSSLRPYQLVRDFFHQQYWHTFHWSNFQDGSTPSYLVLIHHLLVQIQRQEPFKCQQEGR